MFCGSMIRIWTMEADDWRCKCHGTFKAKCVSGSKIAAKLNIPPDWFSLSSNKPKRFNYITSAAVSEPRGEGLKR